MRPQLWSIFQLRITPWSFCTADPEHDNDDDSDCDDDQGDDDAGDGGKDDDGHDDNDDTNRGRNIYILYLTFSFYNTSAFFYDWF